MLSELEIIYYTSGKLKVESFHHTGMTFSGLLRRFTSRNDSIFVILRE